MELSRRAKVMPASTIRRLVQFGDAARARGVTVHHLNIGQPDIATPEGMIEAYRSYSDRVLAYGPSQGLPSLRKAIADYYARIGHPVRPEEVNVTVGGSEALSFAFSAVADLDDEILVFEPFYANYSSFAVGAGVRLRPVSASALDGFHLPSDQAIEAAIGPRTRAIVVNSPCNPPGTIYSREEMERLGRIVEAHDLFLISDEVYREFAFGAEVTSALSLPSAPKRVIIVDIVSKRYSACGARVGCAIAKNTDLIDAFMRMSFARLCPATVDQLAAIAAYQTPHSYFDEVVEEYRRRRDALVRGLLTIEGVSAYLPEGAFYAMVTFPVEDADHFAKWLLTDFSYRGQTVMMAPGSGFYATPGLGKREARLAYVVEVDALNQSVEVLRAALSVYPLKSHGG
jgi:aspartate aminotransferase